MVLFACKKKQETTKPVIQPITESVYASGKIKSKDQYEVFAPINGIIKQVHVQEGDHVLKGDALITLINEAPKLNEENARIAANYQTVTANRDKLNEAIENINLAKAKLQSDSSLLLRQQQLWANEIGSRNELEQRELAVKNSRTAYQTAQLRYQQLKQQLTFNELQSQKVLQISSTAAGDYVVRAKANGRVYRMKKKPGEVVNPQLAFAVIGDAGSFILELQIDEYDIAKVRIGQQAIITMDAYKRQVFEGVISSIDPIMNEQSRSVTVEAAFKKQPALLLPNLTAEANIVISQKEKALTIPRNYLLDEEHVLLSTGEKRKVTIGLKDYQLVELLNGLSAEEAILKPEQ